PGPLPRPGGFFLRRRIRSPRPVMPTQPQGTILHVDDDGANRESTAWALRAGGLRRPQAATGAEALRLAPQADAILLDVRLPDVSGFEVCRRIRADPTTAALPVLQLSGHFTRSGDRVQGLG